MIKHIKHDKVLYRSIVMTLMIIAASIVFKANISPYFHAYFMVLVLVIAVLGTGVFYKRTLA